MIDNTIVFKNLSKFGLCDVAKNKPGVFDFELDMQGGTQAQNVAETSILKEETADFDVSGYIYAKQFNCPVCEKGFTTNIARESKVRVLSVDFDLHPTCQYINPNFYDIIVCPECGYAAAKDYFNIIAGRQAAMLLAEIAPNYTAQEYPDRLDVDMAIERYELALLNSVVKNGKLGEKAYLCMKLMWFYRLKGDVSRQKLFAELTLKGFSAALVQEDLPIMGLNGDTITYLLGALYMVLEDNINALKLLSNVVVSKSASDRLKDKARNLKDEMKE